MGDLPYAKKSLGQHWLNDDLSLDYMCKAAGVGPEDTVLEVGPGFGTLTRKLVALAEQVIAVEFDERFATKLAQQINADNLQVIQQDILQFNLSDLPANYKVVANIPYYLTSKLLRTLSESKNPPQIITLLVQKEVAERVAASPGYMSLLSVSVQAYYQAELCEVVPAHLFVPAPKVDSQILKLTRLEMPIITEAEEKQFFQAVKAGYAARRKTLLNSLAGGLRQDKIVTQNILNQAGIDASTRAQDLSLDDWKRLTATIDKNIKK